MGSRMSISGRPDGGRPDDHQWASAPQNALIAALTPRPPGGSADEPSAGGWMSIGGWASRSAELMWTHVELMWTHAGLMCSSCGIMLVSCGAHVNSCGAHGARVPEGGGLAAHRWALAGGQSPWACAGWRVSRMSISGAPSTSAGVISRPASERQRATATVTAPCQPSAPATSSAQPPPPTSSAPHYSLPALPNPLLPNLGEGVLEGFYGPEGVGLQTRARCALLFLRSELRT